MHPFYRRSKFAAAAAAVLVSVFCLAAVPPAAAESRFRVDPLLDSILLGGSAALTAGSLLTSPADTNQPAASTINSIDAALMFPYSEVLDQAGTWTAIGMLTVSGAAALGQLDDVDALICYALMYSEAFMFTYGAKEMMKDLFPRYRPWTYTSGGPADAAAERNQSFPSGHTSYAFLGASFLSAVLLIDYADQSWTPWAVTGSYAAAAAVAASRVAAGEHFLTDVLTGAALGSLFGWLVPMLHLADDDQQTAEASGGPVVKVTSGSVIFKLSY